VWMQESVPPQPQYDTWPGRWIAEEDWPSERIRPLRLYLDRGHLWLDEATPGELSFSSPQTTGLRGGEWCGFGADGEMPRDQRPDDGGSLVFDSDPLDERLEILGAPVVSLDLRCDKPVALLAARLCDVAPDGSSLRVSYGLLNLTHRNSHETPEPLDPGQWTRVRLQLNDIAHAFPPGHRIRLSLSTSYWPIAWPSPEAAIVGVRTGESTLDLPVRPPRPEDDSLPPFEAPESAPGITHTKLRHLPTRRRLTTDLTTSEVVYTLESDAGEFGGASLARLEEIGLDLGYMLVKRYRIIENDPLSAQTEFDQTTQLRRNDWSVKIECRTRLTATLEAFQFSGELVAYEGEEPVARHDWTIAIPRQLA
jgi:hypothetical protein